MDTQQKPYRTPYTTYTDTELATMGSDVLDRDWTQFTSQQQFILIELLERLADHAKGASTS